MNGERSPLVRAAAGYVLAAVVLVTVMVWYMSDTHERSEEAGSDAGQSFDPLGEPTATATAVVAGLMSWSPASQASPWDAMAAVSDRLTGPVAQAAAARPNPDPTPRQWAAWAAAADRVIGTASPSGEVSRTGNTQVSVPVTVQQVVMHRGGQTTPLDSAMVADVEVLREGQTWKVARYQFRPLAPR